ncbi:hypothetical protein BOTNAR_0252g00200 [Botryotinia narcissicola]|uniref:Mitochondrial carrier protein n=1 Tax=Botryotinia narcissicola TaxID=278944 RepID=A0A4Z1I8D6_9HELO|nr:hypothetical protein BOTNAR_0252g00200 [Botryotinia narcissicola]
MSHERSTPSSSGSEDFASSQPTTQQFTSSLTFGGGDSPITRLERVARTRAEWEFNAFAGAVGGFTSGVVTCPLDVIKTKLQAQGGFRAAQGLGSLPAGQAVYNGLLGTGRVIWREEGLKGLYRGFGSIILGYLPTWAVLFTVYGRSKQFFGPHTDNTVVVNFWSSIIAGASSTMVTNPIWVIKTRLMSQVSRKAKNNGARPPWHYRSTLDAAKFPAYEYLKKKFTGKGMGESAEGDESAHLFGVFSASVLSKVIASSTTYPHEVIRTRLQTQQRSMPAASTEYGAFRGGLEGHSHQHGASNPLAQIKQAVPKYRGIVMTFKTILREEGWRAFYAGMGTNMMRAVPAATTTMLTYEYVMKHLNHAKAEGLRKSGEDW